MLDKTRDDVMENATERVLRIRTQVILARKFYGVLVSNVTPVVTRKIERAATDSVTHYWNPEYVLSCSYGLLLFTQLHESEHDARRHSMRRGNRDPFRWNVACDYAINIDLKDQRFEVPEWAYCDAKYRGMSAEDIYRCLELDEKAKQQQPQPQPQEDGDDASEDQQSGDGDDQADDGDEAGDEQGEGQGDDSEQGEDEGQGSGQGEGEAGDDEAKGQGQGEGQGDEGEGEGQGSGQGSGDAAGEGAGHGTGDAEGDDEATTEAQDGEQSANPTTPGDPRSVGDVLDTPADVDPAAEDQRWERVVRQAVAISRGTAPGHATADIERANNPSRNWREELRAFFEQGASRLETWNRPNRRFVGRYNLPGYQKEGLNKVVFLIDTSGSMDDIALKCVNTEAQAAMDEGIIDNVIVVYGDTRVTRVDEYNAGDIIEFNPYGRGGTAMRPLYDYVRDEVVDPSLIINFTDLEIEDDLGEEPACPVLFAVTGYPDKVRKLLENTPWGAPGIDVGAH